MPFGDELPVNFGGGGAWASVEKHQDQRFDRWRHDVSGDGAPLAAVLKVAVALLRDSRPALRTPDAGGSNLLAQRFQRLAG